MTQVLRFTAEDVTADGDRHLRQTFQSIRMEIERPDGQARRRQRDAATTGQDPAAQGMRRVLAAHGGESVIFDMTADGAVRRVDGVSRIADKLAGVMRCRPRRRPGRPGVQERRSATRP